MANVKKINWVKCEYDLAVLNCRLHLGLPEDRYRMIPVSSIDMSKTCRGNRLKPDPDSGDDSFSGFGGEQIRQDNVDRILRGMQDGFPVTALMVMDKNNGKNELLGGYHRNTCLIKLGVSHAYAYVCDTLDSLVADQAKILLNIPHGDRDSQESVAKQIRDFALAGTTYTQLQRVFGSLAKKEILQEQVRRVEIIRRYSRMGAKVTNLPGTCIDEIGKLKHVDPSVEVHIARAFAAISSKPISASELANLVNDLNRSRSAPLQIERIGEFVASKSSQPFGRKTKTESKVNLINYLSKARNTLVRMGELSTLTSAELDRLFNDWNELKNLMDQQLFKANRRPR